MREGKGGEGGLEPGALDADILYTARSFVRSLEVAAAWLIWTSFKDP